MNIAAVKNLWRVHSRFLLAGLLISLSLAALSIWYRMPIYPDEISFRMQLGRYIQDYGMVQGLYPLCVSNVKETPLIFLFPAWLFSWMDLAFSPVRMRLFSFFAVLMSISIVIWRAVKDGINPIAVVIVISSFIGVAGSGLVLARYEYAQIFNIACCMLVFMDNEAQRLGLHTIFLTWLLLASVLISLYAHLQGLLFLPLTLYLLYRLVCPHVGRIKAALMILFLFGVMVQTSLGFHHSTCVEYPEIAEFWARMTLNFKGLASLQAFDWLLDKIDKYIISFQYVDGYAIKYLPGITLERGWLQWLLSLLNQSIRFILLMNLSLAVYVILLESIRLVKQYGHRQSLVCRELMHKIELQYRPIEVLFLASPLVFLFIYDSAHNFYRSFFLNLLFALLLASYLSRIRLMKLRIISTLYFGLCVVTVLASLWVNNWWFANQIRAGYEGPSISVWHDWKGIRADVDALAQECGMDLATNGGVIVDDMTYDSLKKYPRIYAATYIALSAELTRLPVSDVLAKIGPNYAIARCDTFRGVGLPIQRSRNELCCTNFIDTRATY